jgi:hypothetical protein
VRCRKEIEEDEKCSCGVPWKYAGYGFTALSFIYLIYALSGNGPIVMSLVFLVVMGIATVYCYYGWNGNREDRVRVIPESEKVQVKKPLLTNEINLNINNTNNISNNINNTNNNNNNNNNINNNNNNNSNNNGNNCNNYYPKNKQIHNINQVRNNIKDLHNNNTINNQPLNQHQYKHYHNRTNLCLQHMPLNQLLIYLVLKQVIENDKEDPNFHDL